VNLLQAMADEKLFARWFRDSDTWAAWRAFIAALFALPMSESMLATYGDCTGRTDAPEEVAREGWLIVGRRGGKSFVLALIAVFLACFRDYRQYLQPGERGTVMILAADRRQARVIFRYVVALLTEVPMLRQRLESEPTQQGIDLTKRVTIEIHAANFRSVRGYSIVAALCDEAAFWRSDEGSANPDTEVLAALRPAMASIPGSMLLVASSPYARRGELWKAYRRHWGKDGRVLVWKAPTRTMNPTIPQEKIDAAYAEDAARAKAEYGAEFRADIEAFVSREVVEACVETGSRERAPLKCFEYRAFVDPAGGSGLDAMTLAIGHGEDDLAILDAVREVKPRFSPEQVTDDFSVLLKRYGISSVTGDRYAGDWPREQFRKRGIAYRVAEKPRSDLYRDFLPMLNSGQVDLLDNDRLVEQLVSLERRTGRSGKDSIDHSPGSHDDLANAVAGVLTDLRSRDFVMPRIMSLGGDEPRGGLGQPFGGGNFEDWLRHG